MIDVAERLGSEFGVNSAEVSGGIREFFQAQVGLLIESNVMDRWVKGGKEHFRAHSYVDAEQFTPEWDEAWEARDEAGYVADLRISRDVKSGRIASAELDKRLPATITSDEAIGLYRADTATSRFQFPQPHSSDETPRVVFDSWRTPYTQMSLAAAALSSSITSSPERQQSYNTFYNRFIETDGSNIPLAAVALTHTVYGRRGWLEKDQQAHLISVVEDFEQGVQEGIASQRRLAAELAAERH